jgi:hypothetical protein
VVTASAIVATIAAGAAVVLEMAIHTTRQSRTRTVATMAAAEKMEQLRSLTWSHTITSGPAIRMSDSDVTTEISNHPQTDDGPGLLTSPAGTLTANVTGYVDYRRRRSLIGNLSPPPLRSTSGDGPFNRYRAIGQRAHFEVIVGARGTTGGRLPTVRLITMEARK